MLLNKSRPAISILGVCSSLGQKIPGVEKAPDILRDNGLIDLFADLTDEIFDLGNIYPDGNQIDDCWNLISNVRKKIIQSHKQNCLQVTIGGDHSIAIGTVQASLINDSETRLVWIDAHGDINTPDTTLSGNLHGMPLAYLLGLFKNSLDGPFISPENVLLIGVRDLDLAEKEIIQTLGIQVITANELHLNLNESLQLVTKWINSSPQKPIHLSFDIDSLDPEFAPATGIRVSNGLSLDCAKKLVQVVAKSETLVSLDIVEINPSAINNIDELRRTISSIKEILLYAIGGRQLKIL